MDRITGKHRSWNMSRIRNKNTKPEIRVRKKLHKLGYRFRLHRDDLPGCPDIVLPRHNTVIFVHGCYWHRHPGCKYSYTPKSRIEFWTRKFKENVKRDQQHQDKLSKLGWRVGVIWECESKDDQQLEVLIQDILSGNHCSGKCRANEKIV